MAYTRSVVEEIQAVGRAKKRSVKSRAMPVRHRFCTLVAGLLSTGLLPAIGLELEAASVRLWSDLGQGSKKNASDQRRKKRPARKSVSKKDRAGKAALLLAGKLSRLPKGTSQKQRNARLAQAVTAYAAIEAQAGYSRRNRAEAAFRHGQILGRLGRSEDSVAAFRRAARSESGIYGARALFEAGNMERRLKHYAQALELYRLAARKRTRSKRSKKPVTAMNIKYAERAKLAVATALRYLGRIADARRAWAKFGQDTSVDPLLRIRAFDALAMSFLREKRYEKAKTVLSEVSDSLAAECAGENKKAKSLRRSLERMKARKGIARWRASKAKSKGNL